MRFESNSTEMIAEFMSDREDQLVPRTEVTDLVSHLVWSVGSREVTDVWVGGRQVVANKVCLTIDVDEASDQVQTRAERLAG